MHKRHENIFNTCAQCTHDDKTIMKYDYPFVIWDRQIFFVFISHTVGATQVVRKTVSF